MCKLFTLTNTKKLKTDKLNLLAKTVAKNMTHEKDGFGVMLKTAQNKTIIRKFLVPSEVDLYKTAPNYKFAKVKVSSTGMLTPFCKIDSMILHGRTSTNDVSLVNTHPISKHGIHLMHNGVVEDSGSAYERTTTNDTEHIVERLAQGINQVEAHISGYYATMHYDDATSNITIIKDNIAPLYFTYIDSLESFCFATTSDLIYKSLKVLKIKHDEVFELEDNVMLVINGAEVLSQSSIKPKGRSSYADSKSSLSLGRSLYDDRYYDDLYSSKALSLADAATNDMDEAVLEFLYEVDQSADHTWLFYKNKKEISLDQFFDLTDYEKCNCIVVRADGTVASPFEELNNKSFEYKYL